MIFMPPKHIIEKYLRPAGLPDELINEIPSPRWAGPGFTNPMFPKPVVEQFVEERRPKSPFKKSYGEEEDFKVVAANGTDVWERIASALEKIVTIVAPGDPPVPEPEKGDRVYNTIEAAELLHRHPDVIRGYCRDGVFGLRDASGKWGIRHSEIERFRTGQMVVHGKGVA